MSVSEKIQAIIRGTLYGIICACVLWQSKILFVQAEAPVSLIPTAPVALVVAPTLEDVIAATSTPQLTTKEIGKFTAKALYLAKVDLTKNTEEVVFDKNSQKELSLASITKVMTAYVALSLWSPDESIRIDPKVVAEPWPSKRFTGGETLPLRELIKAMFIESNNDAARAIADTYDRDLFVARMNTTANLLGLSTVHFINPEGTDPDELSTLTPNKGSAQQIARLAVIFYKTFPEYAKLSSAVSDTIYDAAGAAHHTAFNTDTLLPALQKDYTVLLSKTGTTDSAMRNLVLLVLNKKTNTTYIAVVLGSEDNFKDMTLLLSKTMESTVQ